MTTHTADPTASVRDAVGKDVVASTRTFGECRVDRAGGVFGGAEDEGSVFGHRPAERHGNGDNEVDLAVGKSHRQRGRGGRLATWCFGDGVHDERWVPVRRSTVRFALLDSEAHKSQTTIKRS